MRGRMLADDRRGVAKASRAIRVDRRHAERRRRIRRMDTIDTPSKPTKCDGPTSTATSNVRPRAADRRAPPPAPSTSVRRAAPRARPGRRPDRGRGRGQMAVDRCRQRRRRSRIPAAGDGGCSDQASWLPATPLPSARFGMVAFAMPTILTREQVTAIAALAHLELDAAELDLFARQLGEHSGLRRIRCSRSIRLACRPPRAWSRGRPRIAPTRSVRRSIIADALANAPDADRTRLDAGFFRVPRVIG